MHLNWQKMQQKNGGILLILLKLNWQSGNWCNISKFEVMLYILWIWRLLEMKIFGRFFLPTEHRKGFCSCSSYFSSLIFSVLLTKPLKFYPVFAFPVFLMEDECKVHGLQYNILELVSNVFAYTAVAPKSHRHKLCVFYS